jgi:hypothetical protein
LKTPKPYPELLAAIYAFIDTEYIFIENAQHPFLARILTIDLAFSVLGIFCF